jgi:MinD-like ATPase involved in chromosome partitioning or flagellar assembly
MRKVLIVNSAKGGVGKTEVSVGLAKELYNRGEKVSMIDLDITTPNVGELNGIKTYTAGMNMMLTKTQIKHLIRSAMNEINDGWIIIDTPPTISGLYSAITETIKNSKFVYVTTPSKNAVKDTSIGIKFFAQRGIIAIGVIQNMIGEAFGEAIDSIEELGVKTIGEIPLTKDTSPFFIPIVNELMTVDFENGYAKADIEVILSNITKEDIQNNPKIELKFYNLETWDMIREKLVKEDLIAAATFSEKIKSHFDISTKALATILKLGNQTMVMIKGNLSIDKAPLPYELQLAEIVYDQPISKGLPMFKLSNGVLLWHHECIIVDDQTVQEVMNDGGINISEGRIIQSLYGQMYYNRAFERNSKDYEVALVKRHITETSVIPEARQIIYSVYLLEKDGDLGYEEFDMDVYVASQKEDYPDFYEHLLNLQKLVE